MRQTKQTIERLERQLTKQRKRVEPPDPLRDELAYLEWHYRQLNAQERAEHDAILESLTTTLNDPLPSSFSGEFDIAPQRGEIDPTAGHIKGCTCFQCIQRCQFFKGIGFRES